MSGFETDLREHLIETGSPVRTHVATRVYPVVLPQKPAFPCVSYVTVSATRSYTMNGPDNLPTHRMQIDAWALTWQAARDLADAIRERISGFRGVMGGTEVQGIFFETERHMHETDGTTHFYRISQDFVCWFEE